MFERGCCSTSVFDSPGIFGTGDETLKIIEESSCSSSLSSSSIGKNSDLSDGSSDCGETEIQSSINGPLDALDALEEVLPMRRGISKFYNGKSKSFTSFADVCSTSTIKDIAKPENVYSRKRKNLLAYTLGWEHKNRSLPLRSNSTGGISKRQHLRSSSITSENSNGCVSTNHCGLSPLLPPLHPHTRTLHNHDFGSWRSFSLADLQHCDSSREDTAAPCATVSLL